MKRLLACAVFLLPGLAFSQGIRKNFTEMTSAEKSAYFSALVGLYNDNPDLDVVQNMEGNFWNYYDDIYGDLSSTPCETSTYLPYNRAALWEMENALQRKNPRLTIPYWDFRTNTAPFDSVFTFLNQDDLPPNWGISWYPGGSPLPQPDDVQIMENSTKFCDDNNYSNSFNDQMIYTMDAGVAYWIGGSVGMQGDPMYFVYHAMFDKLWQQWQVKNSATAFNPLDRYDGSTYTPDFSPLPLISPSSTIDSRTMGVFYSNNDTALLDGGYTVSNKYFTPEYFSYPKQIAVGNFNVTSGKSATLVSQTGVTVNPGFLMNGGNLEIDVGSSYYNNFPLSKSENGGQSFSNKNPGPASAGGAQPFTLVRTTQGFVARLWLQNPSAVEGYLMSVDGKISSRVSQGGALEPGYYEFPLNVPQGGGLYFAYFRVGGQTYRQLVPRF